MELSFNFRNDWTTTGLVYTYCKKSVVNTMGPLSGPVTGSTILQLHYGTSGSNEGWLDILDRNISNIYLC